MKLDFFRSGTIQKHILDSLGELIKRGVNIELVMPRKGVEHLVIVRGTPTDPRDQGPFANGEFGIWNHQVFIKIHPCAEPSTVRACSIRAVEGKYARRQF